MTIEELQKRLAAFDPHTNVMLRDGANGGGVPRTINSGPVSYRVTAGDAKEADDCESLVGSNVIVLGYGSY